MPAILEKTPASYIIPAPRYVRVVLEDGRSLRLMMDSPDRLTAITPFLSGLEVDTEGNEIERKGKMQRHLLQRTVIRKVVKQVWNLHYGTLHDVKA